MFRAIRLLVVLAVLWCGLHLSPAEADVPHGKAGAGLMLHDEARGGVPSDHGLPHASQACHNHCPVAPDQGHGAALSAPALAAAAPFATPAKKLVSLSRAPPVQPPAA